MQTIGERLEEARKKLGLSVEQAAQATKIRGEYLVSLEKSSGDEIPLQEIYVRGFIRNYGKYLKMETSRLIADFDATRRSRAASKSANKDVIGRLDIGGGESIGAPSGNTATVESATYATTDASENFLKKLPVWAVPTAIGVISVLLLVGLAGAVASCARAKSDAANAAAIVSPIKIYASGNVLVSVQDVATSQSLYAGTLKKGDEKTIETAGEVLIKYSDGSLLEVEKDGKRYKMATSGAGKRVFK